MQQLRPAIHLHSVNARWFTPLLFLCFALFVLGAKAYISRTPTETIQAPQIEPAHRIYALYPAATRREEANARVFKPRPRSLEPLPIMAMTKPIIEPVRPGLRDAEPPPTPVADAVKAVLAMDAPVEVVFATPPPATGGSPSSEEHQQQPTSAAAEDVALAAATVMADDQSPAQDDSGAANGSGSAQSNDTLAEVADSAVSMANADKPSDGPSLSWREAIVAASEQIDDAAVRLRSNYEKGPAALLGRAFEALESGQFERALGDFDFVLARNPDLVQAWGGKGEALVGLNRFAEAAEAYAKAVATADTAITVRYNYGVVLYRLSQYTEAAAQFRAVVAENPDHAEAHYNLATLAQRDGRLGEALEAWKVFTRLQPAVAGGWFNLGIVHMDYDHPAEAAACFKRVIELDQNDADAHINLAMAYMASDQPAEALTALETAESRLPGDRVVLRYLADVHSQLAELGGPDAARHRDKAATCRARIASTTNRDPRKAIAGTQAGDTP